VVAGSEGDGNERQVALEGRRRDGSERAVAAGHAQCLGSTFGCLDRERVRVVLAPEHARLDAEALGLGHQVLHCRPLVPRTRIDQQKLLCQ
jgi:hypothetical protein